MADTAIVHIGENSPEQVAYKLLESVADFENKKLRIVGMNQAVGDRKWLLDTYAECLHAAKGYRDWSGRA